MQFRKDINGLRAIAVLAVVLFHFKPHWMLGGFAGVDVFFVISGFLMTSIIFRGFEKDSFSLLNFYVARAKRIIPALAVMCFVILISTWFALSPADYKTVGKHIASSLGFFSNIVYANESGYFDAGSHEKWLLHTWSLSVEWQFYIIYPLILVILYKKLSLQTLKVCICTAMVLSFFVSVLAVQISPTQAYFSLPSRMWEMMLGGIAYLYPLTNMSEPKKKVLEFTGLVLIFISYLLLSEETPWPGYWALFPALGSFLLIQSSRNDSFVTANPLLQTIGTWSYSIYLWHWPLVVVIYTFSLSAIWTYSLMILSFALGGISYQLIERNNFFSLKWSYLAFALLILPVQFFGNKIYDIPDHIWNNININVKSENYGTYTWRRILELEKIKDFQHTNKSNVLVIGDSQAGDLINSLYESGSSNELDLLARIVPAKCGVFYLEPDDLKEYFSISKDIKEGQISQSACENKIDLLKNNTNFKDADYIVLSMNWRDYALPYLFKSISKLHKVSNAKIYVIGNKGFEQSIPNLIYHHHLNSNLTLSKYVFDFIPDYIWSNNLTLEENTSNYNYKFINLAESTCPAKQCEVLSKDNELLYYDKMHITKQGAQYIGNKLSTLNFK